MTGWISPLLTPSDYRLAQRFAETRWPILIRGETGVGKEYLAHWIHDHSEARRGAFVPVNCSALPIHLVESELFGYERGAFTGAHTAHQGLIRAADGGTLFLDEIGELDLLAQAKLLRFMDSGETRSISGRRLHSSTARVIAATHVDMARAVREGRFRLDLYERLSVLSLSIPSLRARPDTILPIAEKILESQSIGFEPGALEPLKHMPWPGNIRQLRNVLLRTAVVGENSVQAEALERVLGALEWVSADRFGLGRECASENAKLREIERDIVRTRLRKFGGNKKAAAADLGIAKSTLHEMLRRWRREDRTFDDALASVAEGGAF